MTDVLRVVPDDPDPAAVARAVECLRRGGLVAFPTETVYGLGVHALDRAAVQRLFAAKRRPASDPLIVHVGSIDAVPPLVSTVPDSARRLARRFWPGPLTLVLRRSAAVPDEVTAGLPSVAVRVPSHPVARAIITAAAIPIAAPSANLFSRPSPTQASHVLDDLDGRIDLIIDGGSTTIGVESTVLDLTQDAPLVLRPGAVTIEALREVLPRVELFPGSGAKAQALASHQPDAAADAAGPLPSPGMRDKHYAPHAPLTLFEGARHDAIRQLIAAAQASLASGQSVGVIAAEEDRAALAPLAARPGVEVRAIGSHGAPETIAVRLYSTMRELDRSGVDVILVLGFSQSGIGLAVQDRLRRAAARIVTT